jgi:hypothetical protein
MTTIQAPKRNLNQKTDPNHKAPKRIVHAHDDNNKETKTHPERRRTSSCLRVCLFFQRQRQNSLLQPTIEKPPQPTPRSRTPTSKTALHNHNYNNEQPKKTNQTKKPTQNTKPKSCAAGKADSTSLKQRNKAQPQKRRHSSLPDKLYLSKNKNRLDH